MIPRAAREERGLSSECMSGYAKRNFVWQEVLESVQGLAIEEVNTDQDRYNCACTRLHSPVLAMQLSPLRSRWEQLSQILESDRDQMPCYFGIVYAA